MAQIRGGALLMLGVFKLVVAYRGWIMERE